MNRSKTNPSFSHSAQGESGSRGHDGGHPEPESFKFTKLESLLDGMQENIRHLGVLASDPTGTHTNLIIADKLKQLSTALHDVNMLSDHFMDVKIPVEIFNVVDQMENPSLYTKDILDKTNRKNREVNGKIEQYKKFRGLLLEEWCKVTPEAALDYLKVRETHFKEKEHELKHSEGIPDDDDKNVYKYLKEISKGTTIEDITLEEMQRLILKHGNIETFIENQEDDSATDNDKMDE
uniref:Mediator of RNA polymerase II transcription subunit 10 n=1 Tax=Rhabditophanes sp. KR3021 TaxID=114890 RepID=A0AC35TZU8_9BILA